MEMMKKLSTAVVLASLAATACTVNNSHLQSNSPAKELVFTQTPDVMESRSDVYLSMARASKYNVDGAANNLNKKIHNQDTRNGAKAMINQVLSGNIRAENPLTDASKILEFSIIYAMSQLSGNELFNDNYYYAVAAQHLSLGAIKMHQEAWFALKKMREVDRLIRQERKVLAGLNQKLERNGTLLSDELEYKKQLEVSLLKLEEFRQNLQVSVTEYAMLVKAGNGKFELEGRRFYELEDFDRHYSLEIFQEAAVRNRREFAKAKEMSGNYSFNEVRAKVIHEYPLVARLDINGVDVDSEVYGKALYNKAVLAAENLLDAVICLQKTSRGSESFRVLQRRAYDELAGAILTQMEVNYRLVELADMAYTQAESRLKTLKKEIRKAEKGRSVTYEQKLALLNDKIELMLQEQKTAQIGGERAAALRSLYFNAGFSPLQKEMLKAPLKDIVFNLKSGFGKDVTAMLSAASEQVKNVRPEKGKGWAQKENWLEEVVKENRSPLSSQKKKAVVNKVPTDKVVLIQLGAYQEEKNAGADWEKLSGDFPELKAYQPQIITENAITRLEITAPAIVCEGLKQKGGDCLVR